MLILKNTFYSAVYVFQNDCILFENTNLNRYWFSCKKDDNLNYKKNITVEKINLPAKIQT